MKKAWVLRPLREGDRTLNGYVFLNKRHCDEWMGQPSAKGRYRAGLEPVRHCRLCGLPYPVRGGLRCECHPSQTPACHYSCCVEEPTPAALDSLDDDTPAAPREP